VSRCPLKEVFIHFSIKTEKTSTCEAS